MVYFVICKDTKLMAGVNTGNKIVPWISRNKEDAEKCATFYSSWKKQNYIVVGQDEEGTIHGVDA